VSSHFRWAHGLRRERDKAHSIVETGTPDCGANDTAFRPVVVKRIAGFECGVSLLRKIRTLFRLVFSASGDLSTPEGRSQERYRQAARTSLGAMVTRAMTILLNFIVVPLALPYLGMERFGLWMALTSVTFFMAYTDFGLGIGLQNRLSDCFGRDDRENPKHYVSSALFVMALICTVFVLVALFVLPYIGLHRLIKVSETRTSEVLLPTAQAMMIAFGMGLPVEIIQRIYNSYQRGYWGYLLKAMGTALALVVVVHCINRKASLPVLAFVFVAVRHIIPLLGSVVLFTKWRWLRPAFGRIRVEHIKRIFALGISGMGAQIAAILLVAGPALVVANRIGTGDVTPFSVTQKLLGVMTMVLSMSIWSLWPAYSEAVARGDWSWIRRTFKRTIILALMMLVPTIVVASLAGQWVIRLWTGTESAVPCWSLLMAWCVWTLLRGCNTVFQVLLNGLHRMKGQATYGIAVGILGLVAAWFAAPHGLTHAIWTVVLAGEGLRTLLMGAEAIFTLHGTPKG